MNKGEMIRLSKSVKLASVKPHEKVLDLGCGDCKLKKFLPDVDYLGIDIKKKAKNVIEWDLERGLPPEIRKRKFDIIFMNEFIKHIENFKTLLIQCKNILSKNGRIILSTPSPNRFIIREDPTHIHCFRKTNIINLARICGLKVTKIIGSHIRIPVLHWIIPTNQTFYSDVIIYRLDQFD